MGRDELIAHLDALSPEEHAQLFAEAKDRRAARRERAVRAAARLRGSIVVPLPWTNPPLSLNDRNDRNRGGSRKIAEAKAAARAAIRAAEPRPIVAANLTLHLQIANRRRRDSDNLGAVLKVVSDALVAEGVLPDDSWVCVPRSGCEIHPPRPGVPASMWVELAVITEYQEQT